MATLPTLRTARVPAVHRGGARGATPPLLAGFPWERAAALGSFVLADGSAAAEQPTAVRLARDPCALYIRFDCADRDAWGTYRQRNDPIYSEEAVEVFLAPGEEAPRRYFELEVSPLGVLFAARIENPAGGQPEPSGEDRATRLPMRPARSAAERRTGLVADTSWVCRGLEWQAGLTGTSEDWWAELAIPWAALLGRDGPAGSPGRDGAAGSQGPAGPWSPVLPPPRVWRANFYRIERPRGGQPELSCWSPTLTAPPDFHRPERFGVLELGPDP
jgi:hypothetical protein